MENRDELQRIDWADCDAVLAELRSCHLVMAVGHLQRPPLKWGGLISSSTCLAVCVAHLKLTRPGSRSPWRSATSDWIDESLRDVASMFSDDGDENESIIAHKAPMIGRHLAGDRLVGRCSGNSRTFLDAS
jgi:hypothetical protein